MSARKVRANCAYPNHFLATAHRKGFAEGLSALLPCYYWIYWDVGRRGSTNPGYRKWIERLRRRKLRQNRATGVGYDR